MRVLPFWILVRLKWRSASAGEWVVLYSIRFGSCESMASQPGLRETDLVAASRHIKKRKASHKNKHKNNNNKNNKMPIPIPFSNEAGTLKTKVINCS